MHVLKMSAQIAALRELFVALRTSERSTTRVLPEVVSQVATFFEDGAAASVAAPEVKLDPASSVIPHFYSLVPTFWYACKKFRLYWTSIDIIFNGLGI